MNLNHTILLNKAYLYRGIVLELSVVLEKSVEELIIKYITHDIESTFKIYTLLFEKISFDGKISILDSILKKLGYKEKKLIGNIRECKDLRNFFAHQLVSYSKEDISKSDKEVVFTTFRGEILKKSIDEKEINRIMDLLTNTTEKINRIIDEKLSLAPTSE